MFICRGGGEHSLALDVDGAVWAWGTNEHGELGGEGGGAAGRSARRSAAAAARRRAAVLAAVRPRAAAPSRSWGSNESAQLSVRRTDADGVAASAAAPRPLPLAAATAARVGPPADGADGASNATNSSGEASGAAAWVACGPAQGSSLPAADVAGPRLGREARCGCWAASRASRAEPRALRAARQPARQSARRDARRRGGRGGRLYAWVRRAARRRGGAQAWPEPRLVREASRLYNLTTVSCGSTHCVALGRCNERIDLCGVCGGDDSTCFLGDREVQRPCRCPPPSSARRRRRAS